MISQAIQHFFVYDEACQPVSSFPGTDDPASLRIYEVIRVMQGVPLFLEAHLARLRRSARLAGKEVLHSDQALKRTIRELIYCNQTLLGNIKLEIEWSTVNEGAESHLKAYFIPHRYPSADMYEKGVAAGLLRAERDNPNAKVENKCLRAEADERIRREGFFEILLVDHQEHITEGSRSNFFLIRAGEILTPPLAAVLPGITRSEVIRLVRLLDIPLRETEIPVATLADADAAFITGTSPGVLPLARIEDQYFRVDHPLLTALRMAYDQRVAEYIQGLEIAD